MKHINLKLVLLFLLLSLIPLKSFAADTLTFDEIVFFGDSLSDNGNLYANDFGILPKSPPYYHGRFSNGLIWSEKVAARFVEKNVTSQNFSVGGETVNLHDPFEGFLPYALTASLDNYYFHNLFTDRSHTLFIIWIGANDYIHGAIKDPEKTVDAVISTIESTIQSLISNGGRNFIIFNLPDLGLTPSAKNDDKQELLTEVTALHNTKLQASIKRLQGENANIKIREFDVNAIYTELLKHPEVYNQKYHTHITNVTDTCWPGAYTLKQLQQQENSIAQQLEKDYRANLSATPGTTMPKNLNFRGFAHYVANDPDLGGAYAAGRDYANGVVPCADPDSYAFWDTVHPTAVVHSILTEIMTDTINQYFQVK